ncbi:MAG TPA: hypothetical protein VFW34_10695 [Candidatus Rubrimentiphilum sp.]|nr:hypothetical protein [Candidatus Rubrimentiphilum sp.]
MVRKQYYTSDAASCNRPEVSGVVRMHVRLELLRYSALSQPFLPA